MKKKVLSVILSTAMIASVLAGCGGGGEAPAADGGSAAPAADSGSAGSRQRQRRGRSAGSRQRQRRGRSAGNRFCGRRCGRDYLDVLG